MTHARLTLAALLSLALAPCLVLAQGESSDQPAAKAPKPPSQAYELTVTVQESEGGKALVDKTYTLIVLADDERRSYEHLRDGDRVSYKNEKGEILTDNIGTNVDVNQPKQQGDKLVLELKVSNTSLLGKGDSESRPQEHDWIIQVTAVLVPGKPAIVYSTNDAVAAHKVEIQATANLFGAR
jgi:hypothetical protein